MKFAARRVRNVCLSILVAVATSDPERYALEAVLVDVLPSYGNRGPGGSFHREYWLAWRMVRRLRRASVELRIRALS